MRLLTWLVIALETSLLTSQTLILDGWSKTPVREEDRENLLGSFLVQRDEDVETVLPANTYLENDPVLGEVIANNIHQDSPRLGRILLSLTFKILLDILSKSPLEMMKSNFGKILLKSVNLSLNRLQC